MVLDGIILMYGSLSESEKCDAAQDVSKITRQTLSTLRFDTTPVIVNSLKLLEALATDHAKDFIPDLGAIFPRIQRYMDDVKIAIRHHALKLGGALVVRIPFDIVGRFIFAAIEYKPSHPEISLKLAALSLLSITPSYSMSSNPLLSRIMLIAGDYIDSSTNVFDSPRGSAASDVAKDTIALSLMTLCFSSLHVQRDGSLPSNTFKNVEDMLPVKLSTILGIPPQSPLSVELCRRAKTSDFPSLRQDSYLSSLATIAMEASLVSQQSTGNIVHQSPDSNLGGGSSGAQERKKPPQMSIQIPDFTFPNVTPIKTTINTLGSVDSQSEECASRRLHFDADNGESVLQQGSNDEDMSICPPTSIESYQPSWTPQNMDQSLQDSSPWAHPSNLPSSPITAPFDRSKLKSIKKGGRKPGSRLRARTADEVLQQDDLSMTTELSKMPATAGNDTVGRCLTGVDNGNSLQTDLVIGGVPLTTVELGFRSNRFEEQQLQQQIQKIKVSGRRGSRASPKPSLNSLNDFPAEETNYFTAKGFKKMETLEFSSDSDNDQGGSTKKKRLPKGIAIQKSDGEDPFGTKGGSLTHSDDEGGGGDSLGNGSISKRRHASGEEEVKTFISNRKRTNPPPRDKVVEEESFSVQGNSFQRQNSFGGQSNDIKTQSNAGSGSQSHGGGSGNGSNSSSLKGSSDGSVGGNGAGTGHCGAVNSSSRHSINNAKINNNSSGRNNKIIDSSQKSTTGSNIGNSNEHLCVVVNHGEHPSGQEVFDYLERTELEPCSKPSKDINKAVKELTTAEWPDIFYLLNTTRRLMIHHSAEMANSGQLKAITLGLTKQVRRGIIAAFYNVALIFLLSSLPHYFF